MWKVWRDCINPFAIINEMPPMHFAIAMTVSVLWYGEFVRAMLRQ